MKPEEMMLGDWISFDGEPVKVQQVVSGINELDYEPIPLTAEILEKNGFGDSFATNEKIFECEDFEIWIDFKEQGYWVCIKNKVSDLYFEGNKMYVHELQHALKLCGIDKEIVL